jgi:hypothetical protein
MTTINLSTRPNADRSCRWSSTGRDGASPNGAPMPRIVRRPSPLNAATVVPNRSLAQENNIDRRIAPCTPTHDTSRAALKSP